MKLATRSIGALLAIALATAPASAQVSFLGPGAFTPDAPAITFSEFALGTVNPSYNFLGIPGLGDVSVDFGGHFLGGLGTPTLGSPLALDPGSADTFITTDGANPTSPVLSGTPLFAGSVSILFGQPVAAVGLDGGYFDAIGGTTIEAYAADGSVIGSVTNTAFGIEFFGVVTDSGLNEIAGISFYITGNEPAGYAIDNLTFGGAGQLVGVPEPLSLALLAVGLIGLALRSRRQGAMQLI